MKRSIRPKHASVNGEWKFHNKYEWINSILWPVDGNFGRCMPGSICLLQVWIVCCFKYLFYSRWFRVSAPWVILVFLCSANACAPARVCVRACARVKMGRKLKVTSIKLEPNPIVFASDMQIHLRLSVSVSACLSLSCTHARTHTQTLINVWLNDIKFQ